MYKTPRTAIKHLVNGASFEKKAFDELRDNQIVALCAIKMNPANYELVSERLKSDPEVLAASGRKVAPSKTEPEVLIQVETIKPTIAPKQGSSVSKTHQPVEMPVVKPLQHEINLEQPKTVEPTLKPSYPYAPKVTEKKDSAFVAFIKRLFKAK